MLGEFTYPGPRNLANDADKSKPEDNQNLCQNQDSGLLRPQMHLSIKDDSGRDGSLKRRMLFRP